jgi:hypothetical protein
MNKNRKLSKSEVREIISLLKKRFHNNMDRHKNINWENLEDKLIQNNNKLWSINEMEKTGGEPDLVEYDDENDKYIFFDCSKETPKGRRNTCYDSEGLEARKKYKPENNAVDMASEMGIKLLTVEEYHNLQKLGNFDTRTSSWVKTPSDIRELGGALFGEYRFGKVFIYHNTAKSYYGVRGFRGLLEV